MKIPWPELLVHVSPVTREVQANGPYRQVRPYGSACGRGTFLFEL
jgi:hypothetical protein